MAAESKNIQINLNAKCHICQLSWNSRLILASDEKKLRSKATKIGRELMLNKKGSPTLVGQEWGSELIVISR